MFFRNALLVLGVFCILGGVAIGDCVADQPGCFC